MNAIATSLPVGTLLRDWRMRRHLSQLDLAGEAEVSTRHLSFVETGRSRPSRTMLLHLAENLDVPLRERNPLPLTTAQFEGETGHQAERKPHRIDDRRDGTSRVAGTESPVLRVNWFGDVFRDGQSRIEPLRATLGKIADGELESTSPMGADTADLGIKNSQ